MSAQGVALGVIGSNKQSPKGAVLFHAMRNSHQWNHSNTFARHLWSRSAKKVEEWSLVYRNTFMTIGHDMQAKKGFCKRNEKMRSFQRFALTEAWKTRRKQASQTEETQKSELATPRRSRLSAVISLGINHNFDPPIRADVTTCGLRMSGPIAAHGHGEKLIFGQAQANQIVKNG